MEAILRRDQGPVTDSNLLNKAEILYIEACKHRPWSYRDEIVPSAAARFRSQLAYAETLVCTAWNLPLGLSPLKGEILPDNSPDLFHQSGASIASLAFGYRVECDALQPITTAYPMPPSSSGQGFLLAMYSDPTGHGQHDQILRSLVLSRREEYGFTSVPRGAGIHQVLLDMGWQKIGQTHDPLPDLLLDVYGGTFES